MISKLFVNKGIGTAIVKKCICRKGTTVLCSNGYRNYIQQNLGSCGADAGRCNRSLWRVAGRLSCALLHLWLPGYWVSSRSTVSVSGVMSVLVSRSSASTVVVPMQYW